MVARNEHTGDLIQTKPSNDIFRKGWDLAFGKKTAQQWIDFMDEKIRILDPDGWRYDDGVVLDTPITYADFLKRLNESTTIAPLGNEK